jgi:hypothetical protein
VSTFDVAAISALKLSLHAYPMREQRAWIAHGSDTAEHEDFLIGNRAGLEALKSAIEGALYKGEGMIGQPGSKFIGVRMVEAEPCESAEPMTLKDKAVLALLVLLLSFLIFALFVGLNTIRTWK